MLRETDGVTPLADAPARTGCCCRGKRRAARPLARGCALRVNRLTVRPTNISAAARFPLPPSLSPPRTGRLRLTAPNIDRNTSLTPVVRLRYSLSVLDEDYQPPETVDLFCPNCNIQVAAVVRATARGHMTESAATLIEEDETAFAYVEYQLALCNRCHNPFLLERVGIEQFDAGTEKRAQILFPDTGIREIENLPERVRRPLEQAKRSFSAALYEPSAIMFRKCLEAVCAELNASGRNLKEKISELHRHGHIDSRLYQWADNVRVVGNDAAHDLDVQVSRDDVRDIGDLTEAILMYVFSLNVRFQQFMQRRTPAKP